MGNIPDSLALGYLIGALWASLGGCLFTLYVRWRYERRVSGLLGQIAGMRERMALWRKIAKDREKWRQAA
jgi:hypothetical protein